MLNCIYKGRIMTNSQTINLEPHATDQATRHAIGLMRAAFPSYRGRRYRVRVTDHPLDIRTYWDGGSRDYFAFVDLESRSVSAQVPPQSAFDRPIAGADAVTLPTNVACVEHTISCGKDLGLTLIVHPRNAAPLLPAPVTTSDHEQIVLTYTAQYKNTYSGRTNLRYSEAHESTKITPEQWNTAKATCIKRGLLNKAGSITPTGRNAVKSGQ